MPYLINKKISDMKNNKTTKPFGTKEWCKTNLNFINGCSNDCKYCYAKAMAIRFNRKTSANWHEEEINQKKLDQNLSKRSGRIMFPSSHDITPSHLIESLNFLERILNASNDVLIVTKPHFEVIKIICDDLFRFKQKILFRFTIGSSNTDTLKYWEPHAPGFDERFKALKYAFEKGFDTSISIEPALDSNTIKLVNQLLPLATDSIWIGKPNKLRMRLSQNGYGDIETMQKADELIKSQNEEWVISLYKEFGFNPKIKWKESLKKVIGIEEPADIGMDV